MPTRRSWFSTRRSSGTRCRPTSRRHCRLLDRRPRRAAQGEPRALGQVTGEAEERRDAGHRDRARRARQDRCATPSSGLRQARRRSARRRSTGCRRAGQIRGRLKARPSHGRRVRAPSGPNMKVTAVETLRLGEFPNLLWVRVHTDEGVVGLGETFFGAEAVEAYIHESVAPYLLGRIPSPSTNTRPRTTSASLGGRREARQLGGRYRALGPLRQGARARRSTMLGGRSRDRIRIYNTCAGYRYVRARPSRRSATGGCRRWRAGRDRTRISTPFCTGPTSWR